MRWYHPRMTAPAETSLVLASASPRRRRLLSWLGVPFEITAVNTPESLDSPLATDPAALARALAEEKGGAARESVTAPGALILTFDTIVVLDGELLGKPANDADAWRMLRALSGRTHEVVTGVALWLSDEPAPRSFAVTTSVRMRPLSDCAIQAWMALGEYRGCAGAYNIEGQVAEVDSDECYQNVAGLPLCHLYAALRELPGCPMADPGIPITRCDAVLGRTCRLGPSAVATSPF